MSWIVKRKHYGGGESVVAHKCTKEEAQARADEYNLQYQTDNYIVEEYSSAKAGIGFGWPPSSAEGVSVVKRIIESIKNKSGK